MLLAIRAFTSRTEYIRLTQRILALLWVNLVRTRITKYFIKMYDNWTRWPDTLFPEVDCALESDSVLYLITFVFNHFTYGGETCNMMRRAEEYASRRIQGPNCRTP